MDFDRRQSAQCFHDRLIGDLQSLLNRLADNHFRRHRAGRDRRAAAKRLELGVAHNLILVDIQENAHDIAALGVADRADAACVLNLAHIARMHEMIHYFFGIHNDRTPLTLFSFSKWLGMKPDLTLIADTSRNHETVMLLSGQAHTLLTYSSQQSPHTAETCCAGAE